MDNIQDILHEINRKLLLCKTNCRKKGKEIIDDLLENELQTVDKYIRSNQCPPQKPASKK